MAEDNNDPILGGSESSGDFVEGFASINPPGSPFQNWPGGEGGWLHQIVLYAAKEPWQFCWYVLLLLSPMFCISAVLSWKLAQALDAQEKDKARKNKKKANLSKVKKGKSD
ncbi:small integral membrane protein 15 [Hyalella azteca]|uniref:Small integral membrane protein 15 n=1 Tax=Hyalella azteca TaxID=294128 RepID=A0A8B7NHC1_HYAAZ|nr:small integral membrane protein 15 [Hyalella azteca]